MPHDRQRHRRGRSNLRMSGESYGVPDGVTDTSPGTGLTTEWIPVVDYAVFRRSPRCRDRMLHSIIGSYDSQPRFPSPEQNMRLVLPPASRYPPPPRRVSRPARSPHFERLLAMPAPAINTSNDRFRIITSTNGRSCLATSTAREHDLEFPWRIPRP